MVRYGSILEYQAPPLGLLVGTGLKGCKFGLTRGGINTSGSSCRKWKHIQGLGTSDCKRALARDRRNSNRANHSATSVRWTVRSVPESSSMLRLESSVLQPNAPRPCRKHPLLDTPGFVAKLIIFQASVRRIFDSAPMHAPTGPLRHLLRAISRSHPRSSLVYAFGDGCGARSRVPSSLYIRCSRSLLLHCPPSIDKSMLQPSICHNHGLAAVDQVPGPVTGLCRPRRAVS